MPLMTAIIFPSMKFDYMNFLPPPLRHNFATNPPSFNPGSTYQNLAIILRYERHPIEFNRITLGGGQFFKPNNFTWGNRVLLATRYDNRVHNFHIFHKRIENFIYHRRASQVKVPQY